MFGNSEKLRKHPLWSVVPIGEHPAGIDSALVEVDPKFQRVNAGETNRKNGADDNEDATTSKDNAKWACVLPPLHTRGSDGGLAAVILPDTFSTTVAVGLPHSGQGPSRARPFSE
jgi:hypothetical protein